MMEPAGIKIPQNPVPERHCGTIGSGWMNGEHPLIPGETVDRQVCFTYSDDNCYFYDTIKVKNCQDFYLYHLVEPYTCYERYCSTF